MRAFDQAMFERLQQKVLAEVAAEMGVLMAFIGDQTGIYRTLADAIASLPDRTVRDHSKVRRIACRTVCVSPNPRDGNGAAYTHRVFARPRRD
jgi:hypothetical protein